VLFVAGDPDGNHVGTATNGVLGSGPTAYIGTRMNDGAIFYSWIDYDGIADLLEVRLSTSPVRPAAPTLSESGLGLTGLLGGTVAYAGFTSGTGAAFGDHDILYWQFGDVIDVVVPVGELVPTAYDFTITWNGSDPVLVHDRVPAEWDVTHVEFDDTSDDGLVLPLDCGEDTVFSGGFGEVEIGRGGKSGKTCNSDTGLWWMPGDDNTLNIQTLARCHDNNRNQQCRPTSCGALYLNYGAVAFLRDPETDDLVLDDNGDPILVEGPTDPICLAAVEDVNGDGTFTWDGSGDEDGDGLSDFEESCVMGTDPCLADTDGDGVRDDVDDCPLEGPADPALYEILDPNGCIRQSECSDGLDNDDDSRIDYPDDASCDDLMDDSEDTPDILGIFPVRGTWAFDLDLGGETSEGDPTSDIFFNRASPVDSNFWLLNGTLVAIFGPTQPSLADCAAAPVDGVAISFFLLDPAAPSTWICAVTNEGRFSAFRVYSGSADPAPIWESQDIEIEFITWP